MALIIITTIKGLMIMMITNQQMGFKSWVLMGKNKNTHKRQKNRPTQRINHYRCRKKRENYMNLKTIMSTKINSNWVMKEIFTSTKILMKILITEQERTTTILNKKINMWAR